MLRKELNPRTIFNWIFHYVNFFMLSFYISFYLYRIVISRELYLDVLPSYLLIVLPSILYHWNPQIKNNTGYRWFAHSIYSFILMLFVMNFVAILLFSEIFQTYILHEILVKVTLPLSIMGFSLLMLLNYSEQKIQPKYFISQEDRLCQGFTTV
ncbi:unnamed protein product [Moneuplotes crassus]|uniref:Uncharacterized protein n=1 Tax=Euplotes crassus TaxID=5936 RepID=A0AAD2D7Q7_EUPCR|nr:unnamed protein product [Moneuplotes crassus]